METQALNLAIYRLFRTDDGKLVFDYLKRNYFHMLINDSNPVTMAADVGRRDVVLDLLDRIKEVTKDA